MARNASSLATRIAGRVALLSRQGAPSKTPFLSILQHHSRASCLAHPAVLGVRDPCQGARGAVLCHQRLNSTRIPDARPTDRGPRTARVTMALAKSGRGSVRILESPDREGAAMKTERFDFTGAEGQHLSGSLDLPERPAGAFALFAHCFTCTKDSLAAVRIARALTTKGIGVLRLGLSLSRPPGKYDRRARSSRRADAGDRCRPVSSRNHCR